MNRAQPIAQSMHDFMDNEDGLLGEILITKEVRGFKHFQLTFILLLLLRILILLVNILTIKKINLLMMHHLEVQFLARSQLK
jgi:hypothetical protein